MEQVSIRTYIDARFADQTSHVDAQFDQLEAKIETVRLHDHPGHITWLGLFAVLIPLAGLLVAVLR